MGPEKRRPLVRAYHRRLKLRGQAHLRCDVCGENFQAGPSHIRRHAMGREETRIATAGVGVACVDGETVWVTGDENIVMMFSKDDTFPTKASLCTITENRLFLRPGQPSVVASMTTDSMIYKSPKTFSRTSNLLISDN